jgi:hypothetical protein
MQYPRYYKDKRDNRFIKRIGDDIGIYVQVIGYQNGDFIHHHNKSHYGSKEIMDAYLTAFTECSEEEYESMIAAFFQKSAEDRKKFRIYKDRKWFRKNGTGSL